MPFIKAHGFIARKFIRDPSPEPLRGVVDAIGKYKYEVAGCLGQSGNLGVTLVSFLIWYIKEK